MAYTSQAIDLAARVSDQTRKLLVAIESIKNDIAYNISTEAINEANSETNLFNGVTGADILDIFTSISAIDTFFIDNSHYSELNKIR